MFERLVTQLLNKYLGQYVQDLDPEKLNFGFLNGKIELFNLKLRPEALSQLDLPIEVKSGCIGYVKIVIPWKSFNERPLVINVDHVLAVVGPIKSRAYDEDLDRKHQLAKKHRSLNSINSNLTISPTESKDDKIGILEKSMFSAVDNIQVCITNVHILYEDSGEFTRNSPFVFGILLHSATVETTNHKWRSGHVDANQSSVFKLIKLDSLSVYWNPTISRKHLIGNLNDDTWKNVLIKILETFTLNGEECQFLLRPVSAKVKAIICKGKENRAAKLLLDLILHDLSAQLSYQQYLSIISFCDSMKRMEISLTFKKFHPHLLIKGHAKQWWHYAINSVIHRIRTFSWQQIRTYRQHFRKYKNLFHQTLAYPTKTNQTDLSELENNLDLTSIVVAREEAMTTYLKNGHKNSFDMDHDTPFWKLRSFDKQKKSLDMDDKSYSSDASDTDKETIYQKWDDFEHKVIFTVANCSFSLLNSSNQEIIVVTFTQLLTNLDTSAKKIRSFSLRLESFLLEGVTAEQELVPIVQADNFSSGNSVPYVFALDFGARYPQQPNSDYVLNIASEQVEMIYQQSTYAELKSFMESWPWTSNCRNFFMKCFDKLVNYGQRIFSYSTVPHYKKIHISCYLKCPTVIFPEDGTLQKDGNLLIVDLGHLTIQSVLHSKSSSKVINIEDVLKCHPSKVQNLEVLVNDVQVLFVDSGDEWRIGRMLPDTDYHLIPKAHAQILCSGFDQQDDEQTRKKLSIALPSFKLNLSDRRLKQLLKFVKKWSVLDICKLDDDSTNICLDNPDILWEPRISYLKSISSRMARKVDESSNGSMISKDGLQETDSPPKPAANEDVDPIKTEKPDDPTDSKEQWARTIDLPGFDDNVSPTNIITTAICIIIGEVVIHMARSSDYVDKPYLMLRLEKLAFDVALMTYGPAVQLSAGCIQLVDKLHIGSNGQYLELLNSEVMATENMIIILYRKVSSDCPEFKSYFHSVEQSLVITVEHLKANFHQGAIITVQKYLEYMADGLNLREVKKYQQTEGSNQLEPSLTAANTWLNRFLHTSLSDPPVPSGATKYSVSFRLDRLNIRLCDSEIQLSELELAGLEMDFIQKANEKKVVHVYLQYVTVTDLSEVSLYSKIITPEEDKVFELKFVQNCDVPCQHALNEDNSQRKCDMHLKVQMRKLKICLLSKFISDIKGFLESFLQYQMVKIQTKVKLLNKNLKSLLKCGSVINLSVDIQAPLLVIPQKQDSPNAIAFQLGDIGLENFVKVVANRENNHYADNILIRWNNLQMSRVIIMDDGSFEDAELILEQAKIRLDIVREITQMSRDHLVSISGVMDTIKINIGQRDLALLLAIYKEMIFVEDMPDITSSSDITSPPHSSNATDVIGKKLQAFFNTSMDVTRDTSFHFTLEGAEIVFGNDRHKNKATSELGNSSSVTVLQMDEVNVDLDVYNNGSLELKCTLQCICLEDISHDTSFATTKILHYYSDVHKTGKNKTVVQLPPIIAISYKQEPNGDVQVTFVMEKTRLNLSVPYILTLTEFVHQAWLYDQHQTDSVIESLDEKSLSKALTMFSKQFFKSSKPQMSKSSSSYSYPSSTTVTHEDRTHWAVSANFKEPEVVFHMDHTNPNSQVLLLKTNVGINKILAADKELISLSITGLKLVSFSNTKKWQSAVILHPCNIDYSKLHTIADLATNIKISMSPIDLRISPTFVHVVNGVINELSEIFKISSNKLSSKTTRHNESKDTKDLWEIKKIVPGKFKDLKDERDEVKIYQKKHEEKFIADIASVQITCELDLPEGRLPVFIYHLKLEVEAHDWTRQLFLKGELQMEASCFNSETLTWEALLEPVMQSEENYRPCQILFKIFRQTACPVVCNDVDYLLSSGSQLAVRTQAITDSSSSDDTNSDDAMTIIRKPSNNRVKIIPRRKEYISSTIDSESDNESEAMGKLATAFGHMFSSSDDQFSEGEGQLDHNSYMSPDDDSDTHRDSSDGECSARSSSTIADKRNVLSRQRSNDSIDSGVEDMSSNLATYVIIDAKDKLNFTVTPTTFRVIDEIVEAFKCKPTLSHHGCYQGCPVQLFNKIGFTSSITIFQNHGENDGNILTVVTDKDSDFHLSPASTAPDVDISPIDGCRTDDREDGNFFSFPSSSISPKSSFEEPSAFNHDEEDVTTFYQRMTKEKIQIEVEGFDKLQCYLPERSSTRIFALQPPKNATTYHVEVNVDMHRGYKTVLVSSPLQIQNCLEQAVHLYYIKGILENLEMPPISHLKNPFGEYIWLATVQPDDTYYVPLYAAYHCHIFFQPAYLGYQVSENAVWWQDLSSSPTLARFITCPSKTTGKMGYTFKAWCKEIVTTKSSVGLGMLIPNYRITLHPAVTVHNYLPVALTLSSNSFEKDIKLEPGALMPIVMIDLIGGHRLNLEMANYNGVSWKGSIDINEAMDHNKTICMLGDYATCVKQYRQLYLDSKVINMETMHIYIYSPYWIINKSNLPLQFRGSGSSIIYESSVTDDPILFRFKHHRRRRCKTRVYNSRWSVSYSIDNIGNTGLVMCKDSERNKKYKFVLSIRLSKTLLTKIIIVKPYFMVVNLTKYHLRFLEKNDKTDFWMDIGPHDNVPIWPDSKNMQMQVKIRDSKIVSQSFFINHSDNTVLRMDHGTALCVNVVGGQQSPWMVIFKPYRLGSAPVRVENHCDDIFLKIHQKSMCQVTLLSPYESILYTWDDPTKERTIFWNICNRKKSGFPACINKDGCGQETVLFHSVRSNLNRQASISTRRKSCANRFNQSSSDDDSDITEKNPQQTMNKKIRRDKVVVHWVSYMDQNQRVLMFTQDDNVARIAKKKINGSHASMEWCLSLNFVGLSLVNDYKEVAYLSLSPAPSVWDVEINHKWKLLPLELSAWLEIEWNRDQGRAEMTDYVQVDFNKMQMTKPFYGRLRRRFFPAVWSQYRCSEYLSFVHFKIHRLQIDSQLYGAVNPTVFHPAPIAPQIVSRFGFHPFIELSFVQRHDPKQTIKIIKYSKVLIQEFNVNLDTEFLEALSSAFKAMFPMTGNMSDGRKQLHKDLSLIQAPVVSSNSIMQADSIKSYMFEYIHISPIKMNFSFSPLNTFHPSSAALREPKSNIFDYVISSIGSTLNEVKNIQLRLVYFERKGVKCPPSQMLNDIKNHFLSQTLLQSYVYIVGVDVLGNPYTFPRDFTQDLGDQYYEPSLGIVQMAEEHAESTAIEMERLLGHYISRSRRPSFLLSGNLEQATKFLSFCEDYRKKHLKNDESSFPESMTIASRSLSVGVFMGISGVHVKPLHGVHQLGIEGYLKGIGKVLLGIISKPVGGDDDMVAIAFDGIRRFEEMGEDIICRMRLPRFVAVGEGVSPYSSYKAAGQRLVWKLAKGHYAESDTYWAHAVMTNNDRTNVILLTDRHVFELVRNRVWVDWNILWKVNIDDIIAIPTIIGNRMVIKVRQDKSLDLFPGNEHCIMCDDVKVLHWLKQKIEKSLIAHMEDRPCPTAT